MHSTNNRFKALLDGGLLVLATAQDDHATAADWALVADKARWPEQKRAALRIAQRLIVGETRTR